MRPVSTLAWLLVLCACGPEAPGQGDDGTSAAPHTTGTGGDEPTGFDPTGIDPTGVVPPTSTTSSGCRSLDLPCPDWCLTDEHCGVGWECRDEACSGFVCEALVPLPARVPHDLLAVGDVDGDARPDIVAAAPSAAELWVLRGL